MTIALFTGNGRERRSLPDGVVVDHYVGWLQPAEERALFAELRDTVEWTQETMGFHGRRVPVPRLTAWFGDRPYTYSGIINEPRVAPQALVDLQRRVSDAVGVSFNSCLGNLYRDGNDTVGWHSDDEKDLDVNAPIASVSLGELRRFLMRHVSDKRIPNRAFVLGAGDLFVMGAGCQQQWQHTVPRQAQAGMRISLTFRRMAG